MKKKNKKGSAAKDKEPKEEAPKEEPEDTPAPETETAVEDDSKAVEDDRPEESSPSSNPSLAQQSKLRSTSFRAGSTGSPTPFSPDGDTAPDIYRKHVARIEELEKENKRLAKESEDSEKRWKKAEDELADLREAEGDAAKKGEGDVEKLVGISHAPADVNANSSFATEERDRFSTATEFSATATSFKGRPQPPSLCIRPRSLVRPAG